jgi:outer membrane lipoprotein-sorting protein
MTALVNKVKAKLEKVNDYVAEGSMKTDVAFIKAPVGRVKVYFKKPNHFKLKRDGGISILPKGGVTVNMSTLVSGNDYVAIDAGDAIINGTKVKVVKLLPTKDNSDVVLSTLYIDETNLLILKAATTTKENGSFEIEMSYGKYIAYALPDKMIFSFNTKDYKMPKGVALEFDDEEKLTDAEKIKRKKGRVQITYSSYIINKGVDDGVFK